LRNVLIAIGNSGDAALAEEARRLLGDASPLVRGAAVWALGQLVSPNNFAATRANAIASEHDESVREEWRTAGAA
jgi:epoxyqueuosine reductase